MGKIDKFMPGMKDGVLNLQLSEIETEALLDILSFAQNAALLIIRNEDKAGNTPSKKMFQYASDSKELIKIIMLNLDIGKPTSEEIN